ncbi:MAG: hypothetical protein ACREKL_05055 [Chthoniobacterales bacterium]
MIPPPLRRKIRNAACAALLASLPPAIAKPAYTVRLVEGIERGMDINASGDVLGYTFDDETNEIISYYFAEKKNDPTRFWSEHVSAINDAKMLVGSVGDTAAVFDHGRTTLLGKFGGKSSSAINLNNFGVIVGTLTASDDSQHAFLYADGTMTDLGAFGGANTWALAVNSSRQIAGVYQTGSGQTHTLLYANGAMTDIDALADWRSSYPWAINDSGQIVGEANLPTGHTIGFLYSGGAFTDLGNLGAKFCAAHDINNHGEIVGTSNTRKGKAHPFVYRNGRMTDLNTLVPEIHFGKLKFTPVHDHDELVSARAINDKGQILVNSVGPIYSSSTDYWEDPRVYVLTPIPTVKILGGRARATHRATIAVHGRAHYGSRKVVYRIGTRGPFRKADGTERWSFRAKVPPGATPISVMSIGPGGRSSVETIVVTRR